MFVTLLLVGSSVGATSSRGGTSRTAPSFPTPIRHVVLVYLENAEYSTVLANGSFERYLARTYASATHEYALCHPSAPNYLAVTSGRPWQCGSDAYHVLHARNLADLVQTAGRTWGAFDESMPHSCDTNDSGNYAVRHNPFVFYADIVQNKSRCHSHDVGFPTWASDVNRSRIPDLSFITPNLLDDGHNTNVSYADKWLAGWLSPLLNDSFFAHTAFLVTYDEGSTRAGYTTGNVSAHGGHVYLSVVSPYSKGGLNFTNRSTEYDVLTTVEWLLGLGTLGQNDSSSFPALTSIFHFPRARGILSEWTRQPFVPGSTPGGAVAAVIGLQAAGKDRARSRSTARRSLIFAGVAGRLLAREVIRF